MAPVGTPLCVARCQASAKQVPPVKVPLLQATLTIKGSMLSLTSALTCELLKPVLPQLVELPKHRRHLTRRPRREPNAVPLAGREIEHPVPRRIHPREKGRPIGIITEKEGVWLDLEIDER